MGFLDLFKGIGDSKQQALKKKQQQQQQGGGSGADTVSAMSKLRETVECLEKKEAELERRINVELAKAKDLATKNQKAALNCLRRKNALEEQLKTIQTGRMRLEGQMMQLELTIMNVETSKGLQASIDAQKMLRREMTVEKTEDIVDELMNIRDEQQQIEDAFKGLDNTDLDDELEAELHQLTESRIAEEMLLQTSKSSLPVVAAPAKTQPSSILYTSSPNIAVENNEPEASNQQEEEELEELKRTLAL